GGSAYREGPLREGEIRGRPWGGRLKVEGQKPHAYGSRRLEPVISGGASRFSRRKIVGATSARIPDRTRIGFPAAIRTGTGLSVCAVWGSPVASSIICSALP